MMFPIEIESIIYQYAFGIPYQKLQREIEVIVFDFVWGPFFTEIYEFWSRIRKRQKRVIIIVF